ncbi:hypothetical protein BGZ59_000778 [Podila verticillata]|nr:hypothetical protein BGZ59_000778 [Podila verticillata]
MSSYPLKDLSLVRATSPAQIRQVWLSNQVQWGSTLDTDLWLDMADLRTHHDFGPGFGYQIWVLVPTAQAHDPNATILSAAHTFDRPGYLTTRDKEDTPALKDVRVANVLCVFTPVHLRGHGYGKHLMKLLWEHFDLGEESTKTDFSFLYSAIGPKFYETLGWKTLPSIELCIPTMDDGNVFEFPTIQHSTSEPSPLEDITLDNLQDVVDKDISLLTSDLLSMATNRNNRYLAILPDARCIKRHLKEAQFITQRVFHSQKSINRVGARILGGSDDVFILWSHRPQVQLLLILRLRYTTLSQLQVLLKEAVQEAIAWQIPAVSVYGVDGYHVAVTTGLLNQERVGALSCLGEFRTSGEMCPIELIIDEGFIWR